MLLAEIRDRGGGAEGKPGSSGAHRIQNSSGCSGPVRDEEEPSEREEDAVRATRMQRRDACDKRVEKFVLLGRRERREQRAQGRPLHPLDDLARAGHPVVIDRLPQLDLEPESEQAFGIEVRCLDRGAAPGVTRQEMAR